MFTLVSCHRSPFQGWTPPLAAGNSVVRCYSRVDADEAEIEQALQQVWQHYPQNRYDSTIIRFVRAARRQQTPSNDPTPEEPLLTEAQAFKHLRYPAGTPHNQPLWTLKAANGRVLYTLAIANCGEDGVHCGLCIEDITLLPPTIPLRRGSWNLTRQERADAERWFEQDILVKLKPFLPSQRYPAMSHP